MASPVYCFVDSTDPNCVCTDESQTKILVTQQEYNGEDPADKDCEFIRTSKIVVGDQYICCGMINPQAPIPDLVYRDLCRKKLWVENDRVTALLQFWQSARSLDQPGQAEYVGVQNWSGEMRGSCHETQHGNDQYFNVQQRRLYYARVYGAMGMFCRSGLSSAVYRDYYEYPYTGLKYYVLVGREPAAAREIIPPYDVEYKGPLVGEYGIPPLLQSIAGLYDLRDEFGARTRRKVELYTSKQTLSADFIRRNAVSDKGNLLVKDYDYHNAWADRPSIANHLFNQPLDRYPKYAQEGGRTVIKGDRKVPEDYTVGYYNLLKRIEEYVPEDTPPLPPPPPPPPTYDTDDNDDPLIPSTPPEKDSILTKWWFYAIIVGVLGLTIVGIYFLTRKPKKKKT